jgi:hypothetical protein
MAHSRSRQPDSVLPYCVDPNVESQPGPANSLARSVDGEDYMTAHRPIHDNPRFRRS